MMSIRRVTALAVVLLAGCDSYSRPNRPLPELAAVTLDGQALTRDSFRGRPWVINLWVPG